MSQKIQIIHAVSWFIKPQKNKNNQVLIYTVG